MLPLYRQLARLQPRQGSTQAEPRVFFPKSSEEYKAITSKETRLRIAHFLTIHSNDSQREAMMNRFNWVYRQVDPLRQEFEKDVSAGLRLLSSRFLTPFVFTRKNFTNWLRTSINRLPAQIHAKGDEARKLCDVGPVLAIALVYGFANSQRTPPRFRQSYEIFGIR